MKNRCKLIVEGKEYFFVFDNNSLLEFCDIVGIEIGEFEKYAQDHKGTMSRTLFYAAARVAAYMSLTEYEKVKYQMSREDIVKFESNVFVMDEYEFGNLMAKFTAEDWKTLMAAFQASRPEEKKKVTSKKVKKILSL